MYTQSETKTDNIKSRNRWWVLMKDRNVISHAT